MSTHLSEEQLRLYRERALPPEPLLGVSNHLAVCPECRALLNSAAALHAGVAAFHSVLDAEIDAAAHLEYDEIASYVDSQLNLTQATRVETHLEECERCTSDVRELRALKQELESKGAAHSPWSRVAAFWKSAMTWQASAALAGAAACALLLVLLVRQPSGNPAPANPPAGIASIRDGSRVIAIARAGHLSGLDSLADRDRAAVEKAFAAGRIEAPAATAGLGAQPGVLMGASPDAPRVKLLGPLGAIVEIQQPLFRWVPVAGADYSVSIYNDRYDQMATSGWIQATEWRATHSLPRGGIYSWQLKVRRNGEEFTTPVPPAPEARFKILPAADEVDLAAARAASGDSHLVLGILYAERGLLEQAEEELRQLRDQNPASSGVAALLASVERLRQPK